MNVMLTNSISSIVYWISDSLMVKIRVSCYKKKLNEMDFFYKEFSIYNENLHQNALSINLGYTYHLTLENTKKSNVDDNKSVYIQLDYAGTYKMKELFKIAMYWFTSDKIWVIMNGRLCISQDNLNLKATIVIGQYYITLQPIVNKDNGKLTEAVVLTIHDQNKTELICNVLDQDRVCGNLEFFNKVDPSILAQLLVNYMGIPTPGTNRVEISPSPTQISSRLESNKGNGVIGRTIGNR